MPHRHRALSISVALLGWLALALQLVLTIQQQGNVLGALWLWLGFFTITTNLLAAKVLTASAIGPCNPISRWLEQPDVQSMTAMSIIVVGMIYNLMLRQLWHPQGWQLVADVMLHVVMPLLFLLHWWVVVPKAQLRWQHIGYWLLYPAAYLVYALARGAVNGWYPYPFIDVTTLGYPRVLLNAIGVLLAFVVVAAILLVAGHWQARRPGGHGSRA
jgi:hypothetical protein